MSALRIPLLMTLFLAGCSSAGGIRDEDRLAIYASHAGAPVPSIHFAGNLDSWTPLGDEHVALWTRPSQAYLVSFLGSCPDLEFATALAVSSQFHTVQARFDTITPAGGGVHAMPCRIREIRPVDVKAVKSDENALRSGASLAERPQQPQASR